MQYFWTIFASNNSNKTDFISRRRKTIRSRKNIQIAPTIIENKKYKYNINNSSIYFLECGDLLRIHYNLIYNKILFIIKIFIKQEEIQMPKILYNIYYVEIFGGKLNKE